MMISAHCDSEERFLRDRYTAAACRVPGSMWSAFADLGWLGLTMPECHEGASGFTTIETAILAEAPGRHQVSEPFVSCGVLAGGLITGCGISDALDATLPSSLISGRRRFAVAHE